MYALGGVARGGATRGGYHSNLAFITVAGSHVGTAPADPTKRIIVASLTIRDTLDEAPNTLQMTCRGFDPIEGQEIIITLGSKNSLTRQFAGLVLSDEQGYLLDNPVAENVVHRANGIDYTWPLGALLVIGKYANVYAGPLMRSLVATFSSGFTTKHVAAALDAILLDEISFTNTALPEALTQICARIGAYWYVDYFKDIHAFVTPENIYAPPANLTPTHPSMRELSNHRDLSQIVTRVLVEGGGAQSPVDLAPGETILPVETAAWYQRTGGFVVSGPQRISYTGIMGTSDLALGALVGPGVQPSSPAGGTLAAGGSLDPGNHTWSYTWVTASGETTPAPVGPTLFSGTLAPPTLIAGRQYDFNPGTAANTFDERNSGIDWGTVVDWCYVYAAGSGAVYSQPSPIVTLVGTPNTLGTWYWDPAHPSPWGHALTAYYSADPRVAIIYFYYRCNGGPWQRFNYAFPNHPEWAPGSFEYGMFGTMTPRFFENPPASAPYFGTANLTGIAVGPTGTTARKVYRTSVAVPTQLRLIATIANNTATTYTDAAADATLGVNAPTGDTSGLISTSGQVNPGSTTLPLSGTGNFPASGGWVAIGNGEQFIRYTGISGNSLTGIPAAGPGAITAAVTFGSTATLAPSLIGIPAAGAGSIQYAIKTGDEINLLALVEDASAQAELAAATGGSGIRESYVQDRRISYTEAVARGNSVLAERSRALVTVAYKSRDANVRSGSSVTASMPAPNTLSGTFKIQDVEIAAFRELAGQAPTRSATASSQLYSLSDLLRMARNVRGA